VFATLAMSALLAVAAVNIDWLGLAGRDAVRVAWLAACLVGAAAVYFGVLLAAGMRPRDFLAPRLRPLRLRNARREALNLRR
jgi:putative peptidoglycan lipid II flippase